MRRLRRAERREQILAAATVAFARAGYAATGLDDVAGEAGVTRVILYRHFDSKGELYRAVIDRGASRLYEAATTEGGELSEASVPGMLELAAEEPALFRLLFHHAAREPEFRDEIDRILEGMAAALYPHMAEIASDERWARWGARLASTMTVEAIMAWLEASRPDPEQAAGRILEAMGGVFEAVRSP